ncbi:hypothetical protein BJ508DRAFT_335595 [Ascobolus immersus RN42]|uniref:Integrase catalytic domain-containing protein n=1 Tax=Ascobolus immersus RN42 TaxID=1160509 RepID=A0A3N4HBT4_ASCIM|nr:hypothetical protein BJ508DRAFT_335595 [Ascobolus immersus RN42]
MDTHVTNAYQSDWTLYVDAIQVVYNNQVNVATGQAPNMLMFGYLPTTTLQIPAIDAESSYSRDQQRSAAERIEHLQLLRQEAHDALVFGQFTVAMYFDKNHTIPPFKAGDKVYLKLAKKHTPGYAVPGITCRKLGPQRKKAPKAKKTAKTPTVPTRKSARLA